MAENLDAIFDANVGSWHVLVKEIGGEIFYSRNVKDIIHPGSIVKVPTSFLMFKAFEDIPQDELKDYLWDNYPGQGDDRNFEQLLSAMLVHSQEAAAGPLISWVMNDTAYKNNLRELGVSSISIEPRYITLAELSFLFEEMYSGNLFNEVSTSILLDLLSTYTRFDEIFIGVIDSKLPAGSTIYNKRGAIYKDPQLIGDIAVIETPLGSYLITMFAYPETDGNPRYEVMLAGLEEAAHVIWDFISARPEFDKYYRAIDIKYQHIPSD